MYLSSPVRSITPNVKARSPEPISIDSVRGRRLLSKVKSVAEALNASPSRTSVTQLRRSVSPRYEAINTPNGSPQLSEHRSREIGRDSHAWNRHAIGATNSSANKFQFLSAAEESRYERRYGELPLERRIDPAAQIVRWHTTGGRDSAEDEERLVVDANGQAWIVARVLDERMEGSVVYAHVGSTGGSLEAERRPPPEPVLFEHEDRRAAPVEFASAAPKRHHLRRFSTEEGRNPLKVSPLGKSSTIDDLSTIPLTQPSLDRPPVTPHPKDGCYENEAGTAKHSPFGRHVQSFHVPREGKAEDTLGRVQFQTTDTPDRMTTLQGNRDEFLSIHDANEEDEISTLGTRRRQNVGRLAKKMGVLQDSLGKGEEGESAVIACDLEDNTHRVQRGETWERIALLHMIDVNLLVRTNRGTTGTQPPVGTVLQIPVEDG